MKFKTLLSNFTLIMLILSAGCKKDDFVEVAGLCPLVISTNPTNGATSVPLDQIITITFNEEMNPATINLNSILISGPSLLTGTLEFDGLIATFTPTFPLIENTIYTGRVTQAVKDVNGNALQTDYVWTFSTGLIIGPLVVTTSPANNENNVALNKVISATFNMAMDSSTIDQTSFIIKEDFNAIEGVISYSGNTAFFTPTNLLESNKTYTGILTTRIKNLAGVSLVSDYIWTFTTSVFQPPTVISTDPFDHETNVILSKHISATFSEPMVANTITASSFTLKNGISPVSGAVSYTGNTATFIPSTPLLANTTYTARIASTVRNFAGTAMENDYVWTFSTGTIVIPTIISTDPVNNEIGVLLNKVISANFSVPMNPLTISTSSFILKSGTTVIQGTVNYFGTRASFIPTNPLNPNTVYTATITTAVKNLAGTSIAADYVWSFTTVNNIPPTVIATDPTNNATGVLLGKIITATFSVPMDPSTINANNFYIKQGSNLIPGILLYSGVTATFIPSVNLKSNTVYTGTITNSVKNAAGFNMTNNYVWSFTTVTIPPPTVISTSPINNATGVAINKVVTATFSTTMDPTTINTSSFLLKEGVNSILGNVSYSGVTASFTPFALLKANTLYTATITTIAKNVAGVSLVSNYVWSFTTIANPPPTVISTDPINNATGVALSKVLSASFSTAMDPTTINSSSFLLKEGTNSVLGLVTYSGVTASFTPLALLKANTLYTATITTIAKNLAGVSLVSNYVWTFTTIANIPPTVISTDPLNNATGVVLNKQVAATFSVQMDPATINSSTFTLSYAGIPVSGVVSYSGIIARFTPNNPLIANTLYTATITTGAKNLAGISLVSNYVWSFTTVVLIPPTVISTDPVNNATAVELNKTITANFSTAMDPLTINGTSFLLTAGNNAVAGVVTYTGITASFNPTGDLLPNTVYTARITTAAKNLAGTPLANDYIWTFTTKPPAGAPYVNLNSVARFGIIAGVGITNNAGQSEIHDMDIGISPGVRASVTGFPPGIVVNGAIFASDDVSPPGVAAMLIQAKNDLTAAYNFAKGASVPAPVLISGDQGGLTLTPGIYKSTSSLLIASGDLTLDAQGDPNAVWIFQIGSSFTSIGGAGGSIILSGGAQPDNIFWQVGSSATIGDFTSFQGNILALTSVTMNSGATAEGRMLCINGAVVLTSTNIINRP
ncbi:MAG: Ig-like domain-containing protein [Saprospiraceae bacterium]|nr:Ig-like domain-containing protein [Saprospiraceae bacterium]